MSKKHTAQTLKFYLGSKVYISKYQSTGMLSGILNETVTFGDSFIHDMNDIEILDIYPILKTVEQMSDKDICLLYNCSESDIERESNEEIFSDEEAFISGIRIWYRSSVEYEEYDYSYIFCDFTYSGSFEGITPKNINFLIDNDYGAIPSTESPTGYVDLFGMPCVTPKQVEKGVFKHE